MSLIPQPLLPSPEVREKGSFVEVPFNTQVNRESSEQAFDIRLNGFGAPAVEVDVLLAKDRFPFPVARGNLWISMDSSINLNREHHLLAEEIEHESADRMLPPELQAMKPPVTKPLPDNCFGGREFLPQASSRRHIVSMQPMLAIHSPLSR